MRWRNEEQLVEILEKYFRSRGYLVYREQWISWRRADLVAVMLDMDEVCTRIREGLEIYSVHAFFRILRFLEKHNGIALVEEISKGTGHSPEYVKRVIAHAKPYIERIRRTVYLRKPYKSYASELVAVEAKLRDWRHGLVQAHEYLYGANKSYLAIPVETYDKMIREEPRITRWIKEHGLGVIVVKNNGEVEEKIVAKKQQPLSKRATLVILESLWNKILAESNVKNYCITRYG